MFKRYLFLSFSQLFFPFLLVLLFISSVVLLISIAGRTYIVKMDFLDLFTLFSYAMPSSISFIIPIAFFASLVLGISRLAYDYELMVFFSLGVKPIAILKAFMPIILLVTVILFVFSLVVVPLSSSASINFVSKKRADVDVNLRAGELGQKIGDWLVYVDNADKRKYENLILYSQGGIDKRDGADSFVVAKRGGTKNENGIFELALENGEVYFANEEEIRKIAYELMNIYQVIAEPQLNAYQLIDYWKEAFDGSSKSKKRKFTQSVLLSLFPLSSVFLILVFGVANPRFKSNMSYFYVIGASVLYFVLLYISAENFPFIGIVCIPSAWFIFSYLLYRKTIKPYY